MDLVVMVLWLLKTFPVWREICLAFLRTLCRLSLKVSVLGEFLVFNLASVAAEIFFFPSIGLLILCLCLTALSRARMFILSAVLSPKKMLWRAWQADSI